jgi:hypothetical protein
MTDKAPHAKSCGATQEQLVLLAYGELADEQRHRVEQHVRECDACREEFAGIRHLQEEMHLAAALEPSASMLARARMQLDEALDRVPAPGVGRLRQALQGWAFHLRAVPVMASLLLLLGFAGGGFAALEFSHHAAQRNSLDANGIATPDTARSTSLPANIANVNGVTVQPGSNLVQVRYNRLVPGTIEAQASDPRIQQLLLLATQNRVNPGVRVDSVGLLAAQCREGHDCNDADNGGRVRQALMASLRYDKNPGVRLKALEGLAPYVAQDQAARDSVLEALLHDDNPGVRTQAIQMLSPVEADSSVRQVLHTVANDDRNPYLRTVSQETLAQGPEIQ